ncbi:MAG: ribulose-phosphate 3-epimerase [Treponema sp.]|jgi:ribulose-phosphate 3-epimerase|nr:ribulose-phosphate 3-epimerase [Treponema sp.]
MMTNKTALAAPSILSADFGRLAEAVVSIEESGGDWIHVDVLDGHFAPNLSFGPKTVKDLKPLTGLTMDCHLMVDNPQDYIKPFAGAGADYYTFHIEAARHSNRIIQDIKAAGMKAGVCLVPGTPAHFLDEVLSELDLVLVLLVNPGFGGQQMIRSCLEKLARLAAIREERGYRYLLSVDGGITTENACLAIEKGADVIVAGSAFFDAQDRAAAVKKFKGN